MKWGKAHFIILQKIKLYSIEKPFTNRFFHPINKKPRMHLHTGLF